MASVELVQRSEVIAQAAVRGSRGAVTATDDLGGMMKCLLWLNVPARAQRTVTSAPIPLSAH